MSQFLNALTPAILAAGCEVMRLYHDGFTERTKDDGSPFTEADLAAEAIITAALQEFDNKAPIIAEEAVSNNGAAQTNTGFFVDPIDGTREFINKTGEFTINIGHVIDGKPVSGIIYAPVMGLLLGAEGNCLHQYMNGNWQVLSCNTAPAEEPFRVVGSRHFSQGEKDRKLIEDLDTTETKGVGSSLKFCYLALGKADIYARVGKTMLWDTAAGQAILEASGGSIHQPDGRPLVYDTKNLVNPSFIARRKGVK